MIFKIFLSVCLFFYFILSPLMPLSFAKAETVTRIAQLTDVEGEVYIHRGGGLREFEGFERVGLTIGDTVRTEADSSVTIAFEGGDEATLGSFSTTMITRMDGTEEDSQNGIKMWAGNVWNKTKSLLNVDDQYEVETPTTVMGVRGTLFLVSIDGAEESETLSVLDGAVGYRTNSQENRESEEQLVSYNEESSVRSGESDEPAKRELDIDRFVEKTEAVILSRAVTDVVTAAEDSLRDGQNSLDGYRETNDPEEIKRSVSRINQAAQLLQLIDRVTTNISQSDKASEVEERLNRRNQSINGTRERTSQLREETRNTSSQVEESVRNSGLSDEEIDEMLVSVRSTTEAVQEEPAVVVEETTPASEPEPTPEPSPEPDPEPEPEPEPTPEPSPEPDPEEEPESSRDPEEDEDEDEIEEPEPEDEEIEEEPEDEDEEEEAEPEEEEEDVEPDPEEVEEDEDDEDDTPPATGGGTTEPEEEEPAPRQVNNVDVKEGSPLDDFLGTETNAQLLEIVTVTSLRLEDENAIGIDEVELAEGTYTSAEEKTFIHELIHRFEQIVIKGSSGEMKTSLEGTTSIESENVTLENMEVNDLIVHVDVQESFTLSNVQYNNLTLNGGGMDSVFLVGSNGNNIDVNGEVKAVLTNSTVNEMTINTSGSEIELNDSSQVESFIANEAVSVVGADLIVNATINVEGVSFDFSPTGTIEGDHPPFISAEEPDFSAGDGTEGNPYQIVTAEELDKVREYVGEDYPDVHFELVADIDLSAWSVGEGWDPIGTRDHPFKGVFDGNGHTISNLFIERTQINNVGLFGTLKGEIKNTTLTGVDVKGQNLVGALVGRNEGSITNASASGFVEGGERVGLLVGGGTTDSDVFGIRNSFSEGTVTGDKIVGGLVGWTGRKIDSSYSNSTVVGKEGWIGGLLGFSRAEVINSYATGDVTGQEDVGGLAGNLFITNINNSYAMGNVIGDENIGGLVGNLRGSTIIESYTTSNVTGRINVGGLAGLTDPDRANRIQDSFALNKKIERSSGSNSSFGRIVGSANDTELFDNFANVNMEEPFEAAFGDKYSAGKDGEALYSYEIVDGEVIMLLPELVNFQTEVRGNSIKLNWDAYDGMVNFYEVLVDGEFKGSIEDAYGNEFDFLIDELEYDETYEITVKAWEYETLVAESTVHIEVELEPGEFSITIEDDDAWIFTVGRAEDETDIEAYVFKLKYELDGEIEEMKISEVLKEESEIRLRIDEELIIELFEDYLVIEDTESTEDEEMEEGTLTGSRLVSLLVYTRDTSDSLQRFSEIPFNPQEDPDDSEPTPNLGADIFESGPTFLSFMWNDIDGAVSYNVINNTDDESTVVEVNKFLANDLEENTEYSFSIEAISDNGEVIVSETITLTTTSMLDASIQLSEDSSTSISWDKGNATSSNLILEGDYIEELYDETQYEFYELSPGVEYLVEVELLDEERRIIGYDQITIGELVIDEDPILDGEPISDSLSLTSEEITAESITISWDNSEGYNDIRVVVDGNNEIGLGEVSEYTITGLDPDTEYQIEVQFRMEGDDYPRKIGEATITTDPVEETELLSALDEFNVDEVRSNKIVVSYSHADVNLYKFYIKKGDGEFIKDGEMESTGTYDFENLEGATEYTVKVEAWDDEGLMAVSEDVHTTVNQ